MIRRLARVGDRITYGTGNGSRTGTVIRRQGEYLRVKLDEPRELNDWEKMYPQYNDPMETGVLMADISMAMNERVRNENE